MYFYPHIFRSPVHCPLRKRGETTSEVVFLYRQIKEVKNMFVRIVIPGSRNSNMTEHGMCLLTEDSLYVSTKRSYETQHMTPALEIGDIQKFTNAVTATLQRESSSVVTVS